MKVTTRACCWSQRVYINNVKPRDIFKPDVEAFSSRDRENKLVGSSLDDYRLNEALVPSGRDISSTADGELLQIAPRSPACSHGNLMDTNVVSLNCQEIKCVLRALSSGNHGNQVSAAQWLNISCNMTVDQGSFMMDEVQF